MFPFINKNILEVKKKHKQLLRFGEGNHPTTVWRANVSNARTVRTHTLNLLVRRIAAIFYDDISISF